MQIIKTLAKLLLFMCPVFATAQSTYLNEGSEDAHFVDRMEIKQQTNTHLNFSTLRPFNRKWIVKETEFLDSARMGYADSLGKDKYAEWTDLDLSAVDENNIHRFLMNNTEWVTVPKAGFESKHPIFNTFYKTKANFLEVNTKDFFLALNPVIEFSASKEFNSSQTLFLNTRGAMVRGLIANKVGFSAFVTDNQERGPSFFQQQVIANKAVPGVGFYKPFKTTAVDYFDARGYITFAAVKNYIDVQFGYDKNFIGNGYRSLFLSDYGNSNLFLKINTKIWKLNYQNLFMELMPQFKKNGDSLLDRKYAAMHHLSMNVTKWLNIGLFEGIIFGRKNNFELEYLNPVIFYRSAEGNVGSPDNAVAGFDLKANIAHRIQLYGQLLLDEFVLSNVKNDPTNWTNKFGFQLGLKYMDAFAVPNLDLQFETNRVRPFTYSHNDSIGNYTHYNQLLAHPLGANFQEFIVIANYQPSKKWYLNLKAIAYYKGLDSAGINFGGNPFEDYTTRINETGFKVGSGNKATVFNGFLQVSYEWKQNLFLDASVQYRTYKTLLAPDRVNSTTISLGVRLNMFKRNYDL